MNFTARPSRHIGHVTLPLSDLLASPVKYAEIVAKLAVLEVRADLSTDSATYLIWEPSLRLVPEGEVTPRYDVVIYDGRPMFVEADQPNHSVAASF